MSETIWTMWYQRKPSKTLNIYSNSSNSWYPAILQVWIKFLDMKKWRDQKCTPHMVMRTCIRESTKLHHQWELTINEGTPQTRWDRKMRAVWHLNPRGQYIGRWRMTQAFILSARKILYARISIIHCLAVLVSIY